MFKLRVWVTPAVTHVIASSLSFPRHFSIQVAPVMKKPSLNPTWTVAYWERFRSRSPCEESPSRMSWQGQQLSTRVPQGSVLVALYMILLGQITWFFHTTAMKMTPSCTCRSPQMKRFQSLRRGCGTTTFSWTLITWSCWFSQADQSIHQNIHVQIDTLSQGCLKSYSHDWWSPDFLWPCSLMVIPIDYCSALQTGAHHSAADWASLATCSCPHYINVQSTSWICSLFLSQSCSLPCCPRLLHSAHLAKR